MGRLADSYQEKVKRLISDSIPAFRNLAFYFKDGDEDVLVEIYEVPGGKEDAVLEVVAGPTEIRATLTWTVFRRELEDGDTSGDPSAA